MPLIPFSAKLTTIPIAIVPSSVGVQARVLVHALANNTHPSSDAYLDIVKRSGSTDVYLCYALKLPAVDRAPVLLPLKPMAIASGESVLARAYGIYPTDWDTVDWDTLDWENLTYTSSSSPIDLHITISQ